MIDIISAILAIGKNDNVSNRNKDSKLVPMPAVDEHRLLCRDKIRLPDNYDQMLDTKYKVGIYLDESLESFAEEPTNHDDHEGVKEPSKKQKYVGVIRVPAEAKQICRLFTGYYGITPSKMTSEDFINFSLNNAYLRIALNFVQIRSMSPYRGSLILRSLERRFDVRILLSDHFFSRTGLLQQAITAKHSDISQVKKVINVLIQDISLCLLPSVILAEDDKQVYIKSFIGSNCKNNYNASTVQKYIKSRKRNPYNRDKNDDDDEIDEDKNDDKSNATQNIQISIQENSQLFEDYENLKKNEEKNIKNQVDNNNNIGHIQIDICN